MAKFIKSCKSSEASVDPRQRRNLTILLRAKIIGEPDDLIINKREPQNTDDLIKILKVTYMDVYDIQQIQSDLEQLHQLAAEKIRVYGARVTNMLSCAIEATKSRLGTAACAKLFMETVLHTFIEGLRDRNLRKSMRASKFDKLTDAIKIALKDEYSEDKIQSNINHIKASQQAAAFYIAQQATALNNHNKHKDAQC